MYLYLFNRQNREGSNDNSNKQFLKQNETVQKLNEAISSEALLKKAFLHYNQIKQLGFTKDQITKLEIERGLHGKPYFKALINGTNEGIQVHFSISHSVAWWACLISDIVVGLDIEDIQLRNNGRNHNRYEAIAKRFFTKNEFEYVQKHGETGFFDLWIRKEAYIKWKGTGMSEGLGTFELIKDGFILDHVKDAYFTQVDTNYEIKMVCCAGEQRVIQNFTVDIG